MSKSLQRILLGLMAFIIIQLIALSMVFIFTCRPVNCKLDASRPMFQPKALAWVSDGPWLASMSNPFAMIFCQNHLQSKRQ